MTKLGAAGFSAFRGEMSDKQLLKKENMSCELSVYVVMGLLAVGSWPNTGYSQYVSLLSYFSPSLNHE